MRSREKRGVLWHYSTCGPRPVRVPWHSPEKTHTAVPQERCWKTGKRSFESEEAALGVAVEWAEDITCSFVPYPCRYCHDYHLTGNYQLAAYAQAS